MSLIVDALKAAQQERSEQAGRPDAAARRRFASSALRSNASFSMASGARARAGMRPFWVAVGVLVLAVAAGGVLILRIPAVPGGEAGPEDATLPGRGVAADEAGGAGGIDPDVLAAVAGAAGGGVGGEGALPPFAVEEFGAEAPDSEPFEDEAFSTEMADGGVDQVAAPRATRASAADPTTTIDTDEPADVAVVETPPQPAAPPARSADARLEVTLRGAGPRPESALFEEALAAHRIGDYSTALGLYRQLLETQPGNAEILNNYGSALQATGDLQGAREAFERALNRQPTYAPAWSNLGVVLGALGQDDAALAALSEATRLDPTNLGARVNLALVYQRNGLVSEAQRALVAILAIDPAHPEAHYALARLLDANSDPSGALRHYRLFLTHGGTRFPQYQAAVRVRVQQLEASGVR